MFDLTVDPALGKGLNWSAPVIPLNLNYITTL